MDALIVTNPPPCFLLSFVGCCVVPDYDKQEQTLVTQKLFHVFYKNVKFPQSSDARPLAEEEHAEEEEEEEHPVVSCSCGSRGTFLYPYVMQGAKPKENHAAFQKHVVETYAFACQHERYHPLLCFVFL